MKAFTNQLTDNSPMPDNNKYHNVKLGNVPDSYLLWIYENNKCSKLVKEYIEKNLDVLRK